MRIYVLALLCQQIAVSSASVFHYINTQTEDITTVSLPSNVKTAHLYNNKFGVRGIPASYFNGFPQLSAVRLYSNQLTDIPDFCFSGIASSVTFLTFENNLLSEIRKNQFSGLYHLEFLNLAKNRIQTIAEGKQTFFPRL